jgi:hypothetical protein
VSVPESEWNEDQRGLVLALAVWQAGMCRRCGGDLTETTNPLHDRDNPQGSHFYKAAKPVRCHRCTALMDSEHRHAEDKAVAHPDACQHFVELVPRAQPRTGPRPPRPPRPEPQLTEAQQARRERRAARRK